MLKAVRWEPPSLYPSFIFWLLSFLLFLHSDKMSVFWLTLTSLLAVEDCLPIPWGKKASPSLASLSNLRLITPFPFPANPAEEESVVTEKDLRSPLLTQTFCSIPGVQSFYIYNEGKTSVFLNCGKIHIM